MKGFFKRLFTIFINALISTTLLTVVGCKNSNDNSSDSTSGNEVEEPEPVDITKLSIACLGDSLTLGQGIEFSYPVNLFLNYGIYNVTNYGVGWSTCAVVENCTCHNAYNAHNAMCLRYDQISTNTDVIAVMCGVNDSALVPLGTINDTQNTTFYGALNSLCSNLKTNYTKSYVFFMTSFHYDISEEVRQDGTMRKDYYETAVKQVCQKYGIDVFDTYNALDFSTERDTIDNVHATQDFVTNVWTPAIVDFIKNNYKKP
ncbi:MAG: SGNH/GDSL hydrolase family protein [Clostridia bacterium]|nr:SGNH/GDSL hydrolase family protein [Clostridia bacterium]